MADMIQRGADWLRSRLHDHAGRSVTYTRGEDSVAITATVGFTRYETADEYGVVIERVQRDYIVAAADLVLDGVLVLPECGDTIEETSGGATKTYEVVTVGGEKHYRACDPSGTWLRIHTQEIEVNV